jgi:hypothetical protein
MIPLKSCDIILTSSPGILGSLIKYFQKENNESPSKVSHCGIMVDDTNIVEALAHVMKRSVKGGYGSKSSSSLSVFRPLNLSENEKQVILTKAASYVGRTYGYFKIAMHSLDWATGGHYLFRRIAGMDKYPICSWVVAHAYGAAGKDFGVAAGAAQPDDIWDFVTTNLDKYECVFPLGRWV